ncbi:ATP-binding cassette domain-containing protein [Streptomyces sp. NPDC007025]|uniref:ATP-binding cassette domain-containing protein n=1 Tax=Streptomyces sp. NPDC007025 TaxID=3364771 RepID=UPI0036C2D470
MVHLHAVSKRYGRGGWLLRDVEVAVPAGEIVAFTGGNGSGKSTLLRIAVGLSRPTRGRVGARPAVVGYVPDRFSPGERMSAAAYLTHLGRVRGLSTRAAAARADELLERMALVGGEHTPLRELSKGNARKVALAQALLVEPGLLVLDEPWSGLDAPAHAVVADIMTEIADAGGTVLFTDHRESVTRTRATRTYTVGDGRVSLRGPESAPTGQGTSCEVVLTGYPGRRMPRELVWEELAGVLSVRCGASGVTLRVAGEATDALLLTALRHGWSVARVTGGASGFPEQDAAVRGGAR